jgi:signal transduction histidine kinase
LLYGSLLLGLGIAAVVLVDLPLTRYGRVSQAGAGGAAGLHPVGQERVLTNLPEVIGNSSIAVAVLAVASIALGWLVADRALRPLRVITASARSVSASSLDERLRLAGSYAEFQELSDTLNGLFTRLEAAFESQRRFVANASHELRTPLAAERTVLQVALADPDASAQSLRAACQQVLDLGVQTQRLIDALLTLASGQRGRRGGQPLDLAEVTARVMNGRLEEAARLGVRIETSLAPAVATGDPHLVESLVTNLLDNAIRHNVPGGQVLVTTGAPAGLACLSITNTGPVVPPHEVGRLLEPFQQLDGERTSHDGGHGLGLAIIAAVASAHDASLTVTSRPAGGLDVMVTFGS